MASKGNPPLLGAVQRYQTDLPPLLPAWFGSPASLLALAVFAETITAVPVNIIALAKLSLLGAGVGSRTNGIVVVPNCVVRLNVSLLAVAGTVAVMRLFET